jgi:hypothetical protein
MAPKGCAHPITRQVREGVSESGAHTSSAGRLPSRALGGIAALALAGICLAAPALASAATYHVAPDGSDSSPGSQGRPWRTLQKPIDVLRPGDTVLIHPGTYGRRGTVTTVDLSGARERRIVFRGLPHARRPSILGHFKITGDHLRFARMSFDGPTGRVKPTSADNPRGEQVQVAVDGSYVRIARSVVRDSGWHAGIFLDDAEGARIVSNCITGNGDERLRRYQWNTSHGIYWHSGSGVISNNVITGNLARGVQLYQEPHDVVVTHNTVTKNGRAGIQFAQRTRDSVAARNLVTFNGDVGVRGHDLSGDRNLVKGNVGYRNHGGNFGIGEGERGLRFTGNQVGRPRRAASRYRVRGSRATVGSSLRARACR